MSYTLTEIETSISSPRRYPVVRRWESAGLRRRRSNAAEEKVEDHGDGDDALLARGPEERGLLPDDDELSDVHEGGDHRGEAHAS